MRRAVPLIVLALAASACSRKAPEPASTTGASDFASRVGAAAPAGATGTAAAAPAAKATAVLAMETKPGETPFSMQQLGDASGVDLGPKSGGCVFITNGVQMMQATAPLDRTLPGKAVVRIGGQLLRLDSPPGGISLVKMGTDFSGEGFRVEVRPDGKGHARVTTVDIEGESHILNGDWKCV